MRYVVAAAAIMLKRLKILKMLKLLRMLKIRKRVIGSVDVLIAC